MKFNGISKPYLRVRYDLMLPAWAPIKRNTRSIPGLPGALHVNSVTEMKPIPVPVVIEKGTFTDLERAKEDLAAWLITDEPKPLVFDHDPKRTYYAYVEGSFDAEKLFEKERGVITFLCPDPYKYGAETNLSFANDSVVVNNTGNGKTQPWLNITFTASATEFKVQHAAKGEYVRVIRNFVAGDVLEIDFRTKKITYNGTVSMNLLDWANSKWFFLEPGSQTLNITPAAKTTTKIYWNPKWR